MEAVLTFFIGAVIGLGLTAAFDFNIYIGGAITGALGFAAIVGLKD